VCDLKIPDGRSAGLVYMSRTQYKNFPASDMRKIGFRADDVSEANAAGGHHDREGGARQ
jgi:hypothetical protein